MKTYEILLMSGNKELVDADGYQISDVPNDKLLEFYKYADSRQTIPDIVAVYSNVGWARFWVR